MRIAILSFRDAVPTSVAGPADILGSMIRTFPRLKGSSLKVTMEVDFVTEKDGQFRRQAIGGMGEMSDAGAKKLAKQYKYDLVIIPAMYSSKIKEVVERERKMIEWIKEQHRMK